jgi:hypothetical protein
MSNYTTESKIEQALQLDIDDSIAGSVVDWINWVSQYIDNYTGTTFTSSSTTKYYDIKKPTSQLFVDEFTSLTSLELLDEDGNVEDTLTENSDFWTYPLNKTVKNEIRLDPYGKYGIYPYLGSKKVKVTGTFGFGASVPADIEMVATQMVGDIIKQACSGARGVKEEKLGDRSVTYDSIGSFSIPYKSVLDLYRCPTL